MADVSMDLMRDRDWWTGWRLCPAVDSSPYSTQYTRLDFILGSPLTYCTLDGTAGWDQSQIRQWTRDTLAWRDQPTMPS